MLRQNCWILLQLLVLLGCSQLPRSLSATPPAPPATSTGYNCSHSYTLRVDSSRQLSTSESLPCTDSADENTANAVRCIVTSEDGFQQCSSLSGILARFSGVVGTDDCLRLDLEPGDYVIPSTSSVTVDYSLVLSAPSGGVTVSCAPSQLKKSSCIESNPLMFVKRDGERGRVSVVMEGLKVVDCPRPFQFDDLDSIVISNCWFRYISACC